MPSKMYYGNLDKIRRDIAIQCSSNFETNTFRVTSVNIKVGI